MTSRSLAIHCLLEQERTGEPVDQILAMLLDRHPLPDERDRQLAMAMVYGVLRHRRELDALISHFSKKVWPNSRPLSYRPCGSAFSSCSSWTVCRPRPQ